MSNGVVVERCRLRVRGEGTRHVTAGEERCVLRHGDVLRRTAGSAPRTTRAPRRRWLTAPTTIEMVGHDSGHSRHGVSSRRTRAELPCGVRSGGCRVDSAAGSRFDRARGQSAGIPRPVISSVMIRTRRVRVVSSAAGVVPNRSNRSASDPGEELHPRAIERRGGCGIDQHLVLLGNPDPVHRFSCQPSRRPVRSLRAPHRCRRSAPSPTTLLPIGGPVPAHRRSASTRGRPGSSRARRTGGSPVASNAGRSSPMRDRSAVPARRGGCRTPRRGLFHGGVRSTIRGGAHRTPPRRA